MARLGVLGTTTGYTSCIAHHAICTWVSTLSYFLTLAVLADQCSSTSAQRFRTLSQYRYFYATVSYSTSVLILSPTKEEMSILLCQHNNPGSKRPSGQNRHLSYGDGFSLPQYRITSVRQFPSISISPYFRQKVSIYLNRAVNLIFSHWRTCD